MTQKKKSSYKQMLQNASRVKTEESTRTRNVGKIFSTALGLLILFGMLTQALGVTRRIRTNPTLSTQISPMIVLAWHMQKEDGTICEDLQIYKDGSVEGQSCLEDKKVVFPKTHLNQEQLQQLETWDRQYAPLEVKDYLSAEVENGLTTLIFHGHGKQTTSTREEQAINAFAESVYNHLNN